MCHLVIIVVKMCKMRSSLKKKDKDPKLINEQIESLLRLGVYKSQTQEYAYSKDFENLLEKGAFGPRRMFA